MTVAAYTPIRHKGPPYSIEPVAAYKPGAFPFEILGYQLAVVDSIGHIVWLMNNRTIYDNPEAALEALGETPRTFEQEGFYAGGATPEFCSWCGFWQVKFDE